jgi:drug/metabolite transporter (DMT)-like permease
MISGVICMQPPGEIPFAEQKKGRNHRVTPFHLLAFAVAFAMVGISTALALQAGATPLTVVTVRTAETVLILLVGFRYAGVRLGASAPDLLRAAAVALPLAVNNYMLNVALGLIPVPLAVLIFYLWPAIATVASWALGRDRFRARSALGLAAAFAGVALALDVEFTAAQGKGVALAAGAAVTWSIAFILMGQFFQGRDTRPATFHATAMALAGFAAACAITGDVALPRGAPGWAGLAAVGFFYSFALIGLFAATARIGPMRAGFYMNFEPVASVLLAALILGQKLAPVQLAGAALVIGALFLFRSGRASPSRGS